MAIIHWSAEDQLRLELIGPAHRNGFQVRTREDLVRDVLLVALVRTKEPKEDPILFKIPAIDTSDPERFRQHIQAISVAMRMSV